jgi:hypothetical protein
MRKATPNFTFIQANAKKMSLVWGILDSGEEINPVVLEIKRQRSIHDVPLSLRQIHSWRCFSHAELGKMIIPLMHDQINIPIVRTPTPGIRRYEVYNLTNGLNPTSSSLLISNQFD